MDALEPNKEMLEVARQKHVYKEYIVAGIGKEQTHLSEGDS